MAIAQAIRSTRAARKLRPVATERARHTKFKVGDELYFGGIGWYPVKVIHITDRKPARIFTVEAIRGRGWLWVTGRGLFRDKAECYKYGGVVNV